MKMIKKVFAIVVSLAMIMGMSMTVFAAEGENVKTSTITIQGLAASDSTTVNVYEAISLNDAGNEWVVADWAEPFIKLSDDKTKYEIDDPEGLGKAAQGVDAAWTEITTGTTIEFTEVPVGAYVIIANGVKATYTTMVANTYDDGQTYMAAKDILVTAKTAGYSVDKTADDYFIGRGETVTFTVTTTFPTFPVSDSSDNSYKIIDTPTGLDITGVTAATVGGEDVLPRIIEEDAANEYVMDLSDLIGTENENAGKEVVIEYEAVVTSDEGYSNTAHASRNEDTLGKGETKGFTGTITLTKFAEDEATTLKGAEFSVAKWNGDELGTALKFVKIEDGVYRQALDGEAEATETVIVNAEGQVKVIGLDEGKYHFTETKAPDGYTINEDGTDAEITEAVENVSVTTSLNDTKLSSLPSTGGIGTTIFTIGGCLIMIIAAALFFAGRKKNNK